MSDTAPFSPFSPSPPPKPMFEDPPAAGKKPKRGKKAATAKPARKPRTPKAVPAAVVAPAAEKVPTRRRARKPRPTIIPIGILPALAGLAEPETSMLMSIIGNLQEAPKKSRQKIVVALGKVFA